MNTASNFGNSVPRYNCSLCRNPRPVTVLKLPPTPLANEFVPPGRMSGEPQRIYPLDLGLCEGCGHLQLNQIVNPGKLFSDYVYVTGTSSVTIEHLKKQTAEAVYWAGIGSDSGDAVVEIGSNDGTMLRMFKTYGCKVFGVDPAKNIAEEANERGIPTVCNFWSAQLANEIKKEIGQAKLIVANNVMAHVPDVFDFALGVRDLLADKGTFVFEVAHLLDWADHMVWDTIYHEHMSYHAVMPLAKMFSEIGMQIVRAERNPNQMGRGSLRVYVKKKKEESPSEVLGLMNEEVHAGLFSPDFYSRLGKRIAAQREIVVKNLNSLASKHSSMIGYGATAKLTTLMYTFGLDNKHSEYIVDDNPRKQRLFTPGLHIPVVSPEQMLRYPPEVCVIYAWNFADSIMRKYRDFAAQNGMTFVVPMPTYQEISNGRGGHGRKGKNNDLAT